MYTASDIPNKLNCTDGSTEALDTLVSFHFVYAYADVLRVKYMIRIKNQSFFVCLCFFSFCYYIYTSLQPPQHILSNLSSRVLATQVRGDDTGGDGGIDSGVDAGSSLLEVHELQHDTDTAHGGDGVGLVLAEDVRSAAVDGLADGEALADVGAGDEAQGADQAGALVGQDVAVQVGGDDDVVVLRPLDELEGHGVDDLLLDGDGGAGGGQGLPRGGAEEAVRLRQNVGLVHDRHQGARVDAARAGVAHLLPPLGDAAGHGGDAVGRVAGDPLDGLRDGPAARPALHGLLLLDVQVLGVLTHDDHVDAGLPEQARGDALDGAHVRVQVELLAQGDDGAGVALDGLGRRLDGAEERAVALGLERVDGPVGQGGAGPLEGLEAGVQVDEGELEAQGGGEGL